jgi:hypothetical protein
VVVEVTQARAASTGQRGVVTTSNSVRNAQGEDLLIYTPIRLIRGRGYQAPEEADSRGMRRSRRSRWLARLRRSLGPPAPPAGATSPPSAGPPPAAWPAGADSLGKRPADGLITSGPPPLMTVIERCAPGSVAIPTDCGPPSFSAISA